MKLHSYLLLSLNIVFLMKKTINFIYHIPTRWHPLHHARLSHHPHIIICNNVYYWKRLLIIFMIYSPAGTTCITHGSLITPTSLTRWHHLHHTGLPHHPHIIGGPAQNRPEVQLRLWQVVQHAGMALGRVGTSNRKGNFFFINFFFF